MSELERWKADRRDVLVLALFLALVLFTFRGVIAGTRDPFMSSLRDFEPWRSTLTARDASRPESFADDPTTQSYPWAVYAHENLIRNDFPLWNTRMFSGTPFVANRLTGLFNPLILVPLRFFQAKTALSIIYFLHYLAAAWFMYLFLKCVGVGRSAAVFGATAYIFQGAYIPWMGFIVADKAYFIASLYYLERALARKDTPGVLAFITVFSLLATTSYPQMTVFAVYISLAWVLFTRSGSFHEKVKRAGALTLMLVMAFLLGAMQHVPTMEFFKLSLRAQPEFNLELTSQTNLEKYDSPRSLLAIAFPRVFGDYLSNPATILPEHVLRIYNHAYIGIIPAFCFLLFPIVRRNLYARLFAVMSILGLMFLSWNSLYMFAARILPGFRISTVKPDFLTLSSMIVVSSFVLDTLLKNARTNTLLRMRFVRVYGWIIGALLGLSVVTVISKTVIGLFAPEDFIRYLGILQGATILTAAGAALYFHVERGLSIKWAVAALMVFHLVDLIPYHEHFMPLVDRGRTAYETPAITFLAGKMREEGPFRIFRNRWTTLAPNTPMLYGLDEPGGFDSFVSADYAHFFRTVDPAMSRNSRTLDLPGDLRHYAQPFWSFLGIRYLVLTEPNSALPPPWKLAWEGEVFIYENENWLPRWFLVPRILPVDTLEQAYLAAQTIDPRVEAVVQDIDHAEVPPSLLESTGTQVAGTLSVKRFSPDECMLEADCPTACFLVFSDTWFPGWKAWVDDSEVKVYRANAIVKGIVVPEGKHTVVFRYEPSSLAIGWALFGLGMVSLAFVVRAIRRLLPG